MIAATSCSSGTDSEAGGTAPASSVVSSTNGSSPEPSNTQSSNTQPSSTQLGGPETSVVATTLAGADPFVSETYAESSHWICRPDIDDVCDDSYPLSTVSADGTIIEQPYVVAPDEAPVDCFYVYPTTSEDSTVSSDLVAGGEIGATIGQFGRLNQACRMYAPMYRSVTLAGLFGGGGDVLAAWDQASEDVAEAWHHYMANDNGGRGVVLIGHSQGAGHLSRLLTTIDADPAQSSLLVGAYILGASITVPEDADVGGQLANIPLCRAVDQFGCVVTYASYMADAPPPQSALFGIPRNGLVPAAGKAGCVNPAAPSGGPAIVSSAFFAGPWVLADGSATIDTQFVDLPGLVSAECVTRGKFNYLEITVLADPSDARADTLQLGEMLPAWGSHAADINLTAGSMLDMVTAQIAAYVDAAA